MTEIYYLDHIVKAVPHARGWQVHVIDPNLEPLQVHSSSAIYRTVDEAIASGQEFVRQQGTLVALWDVLYNWQETSKISVEELDTLSASLFYLCCFRDSYSPSDHWH